MAAIQAEIASIAHHDSGVRQIALTLRDSFNFHAGQYLNVVHRSGAAIPMSIASAPESLPQLELHYRASPGAPEAMLMDELLIGVDTGSRGLTIDGPFGDVSVDGPIQVNLLLIAGGSGFAQCRSILDHLRRAGQTHAVRLAWSVTHASQHYCDTELRTFAPWLEYAALVDAPDSQNAAVVWLREHVRSLTGRVIVSGGPGFVYAVVDALEEIGTSQASVESDMFSYAPRR